MAQWPFADRGNQDQIAKNVQSDLGSTQYDKKITQQNMNVRQRNNLCSLSEKLVSTNRVV